NNPAALPLVHNNIYGQRISARYEFSDWRLRGLRHNQELADALHGLGRHDQAENLLRCQSACRHGDGVYFSYSCHQPLCPFCNYQRRCRLADKWELAAARLAHPQLITLTSRSVRYLSGVRGRLMSWFQRVRRRRYFRDRCSGGFFNIEFDYVQARDSFHPHIHGLLDATGLSQSWLSRTWKSYSSAYIVDLRAVEPSGIRKVFFYLLKPPCRSLDPRAISEIYSSIGGAPLFRAFGIVTPTRRLCSVCRQKPEIRFGETCNHVIDVVDAASPLPALSQALGHLED
ncbi:MAG: hypothetical protein V2A77_11885, partial [Pseudomonadota bacterium]